MLRLLNWILCGLFLGIGALQASVPEISFPADTVHACLNEVFEIGPEINGGTAPYQYDWSNGQTDSTLTMFPAQAYTTLELIITDALNEKDTATLTIYALGECVYPGDANGDGAADNFDLLNLGVSYGTTGYIRPNAHLNWIGQPSHSWNQHFSGVDFAHSDGDGNGIIDALDIQAIDHNYFVPNSNPSLPSAPGGAPLYVEFDANNVQPGDTVHAHIMIGTAAEPVDSIYGIAFALELTGYEIDSGSFQVNYNQSVLGQINELLTIDKPFYAQNRFEIGMTRFDGIDVNGFGQVAEIIVVIDEIIGKKAGIEKLDFNLETISLRNGRGQDLEVTPTNSFVSIITSNGTDLEESPFKLMTLPEQGWVVAFDGQSSTRFEKVLVLDIMGREIFQQPVQSRLLEIPANRLEKGIYLIQLIGQEEQLSLKIVNR